MSTEDKCHSTHPSNGDATKPHGEGDVESGNKHAEKDAEVAADQPSEVTECTVSAAHSPTTSADVGVGAGVSVSVPVGPGACAVGKAVEEFGVSEPEDKVPRLRFFCSLSEIAERYGVGVYLYFDFLRFVMILNFIVSVLVLCNWVPQVAMYDIDTVADNLEALFVSGYPPTLLIVWQVTSGVACGTVALFGFLYVIHARNVQKSSPEAEKPPEQNSLWEYELMPQTPGDMGFIERNMKVNNCSKFCRRSVSYVLFFLFTACSTVALIVMCVAQLRNAPMTTWVYQQTIVGYAISITPWDYAISITLFLLCFGGRKICSILTHFERHKSRLAHSKNKTFKNFTYKVVLVSSVYWAQWLQLSDTDDFCPLRTAGIKFLSIGITDLTLGSLLLIATPLFTYYLNTRKKRAGKPRAEIHFDLSAQYMDALFRQYMMYLGMTVFPCLCLLTLATTIIMYQMDKFRLVKLCTTKKKSIGSMRYYLAIIMFLTAILGVVMFPSGGVWTLSGLPGDSYCHCTIYNDTCPPENATSEVESNSW